MVGVIKWMERINGDITVSLTGYSQNLGGAWGGCSIARRASYIQRRRELRASQRGHRLRGGLAVPQILRGCLAVPLSW